MPTVDRAELDVIVKAQNADAERVADSLDRIKKESEQADRKIKEFAQSQNVAERASKQLGSEVSNTSRSFDGFGKIVAGAAAIAAAAVVGLAVAFRDGLAEIEEQEAAMTRLASVAAMTGKSFDALNQIAEDLAADGFLQLDQAMQGVADLAQKGFNTQQIREMGAALKDIAAAAGGDVAKNFKTMTDAITTGRFVSAELQRFLPGLKNELADLGSKASLAEKNQALLNVVLEQGSRVAGAAADKANTLAGQQQILANKIADAKEAFAAGLIPTINQAIQAFEGMSSSALTLADYAEVLAIAIGVTLRDAFTQVALFMNSAATIVSILQRQWLELANVSNIASQKIVDFGINTLQTLKAIPGVTNVATNALGLLVNAKGQLVLDSVRLRQEIAKEHKEFNSLISEGVRLEDQLGKLPPLLDRSTTSSRNLGGGFEEASQKAKTAKISISELNKEIEKIAGLADTFRVLDFNTTFLGSRFVPDLDSTNLSISELGQNLNSITATGGKFTFTFTDASVATAEFGRSAEQSAAAVLALEAALNAASAGAEKSIPFFVRFSQILDTISIGFDVLGQIAGSDTLGQIGQAFQGGATAAAGFAQILNGDVINGIQNVIRGVGQLFAALKDLFSHDWAEDTEHQFNRLYRGLQISEELFQRITADAEKFGNAATAAFLHFGDVVNEVGLSVETIDQLLPALRDGFSLLEVGLITSAQLTDTLNAHFQEFAEVSMDAFGRISPAMKEIIALTRAFGLEVEAITNFLRTSLTNAASGLNAIVGAGLDNARDVMRAMRLFSDQFNAMMAQGFTFDEAMEALGPSFDAIKQKMKELGLEGTAAFKAIVAQMRFLEKNQATLNGLQGVIDMLVNLDNAGLLNQRTFKDLERTAADMFKKFNADGKISNRELKAMAPTLALLEQLAAEYGFTLDAGTQELIEMARNKGFLDQAKQAETLQDAVGKLVEEIRALIAELRGIPSNVNTTVTTTYTTSGTPPPADSPPTRKKRFATLNQPIMFTRTTDITVDRGETLLPSSNRAHPSSSSSTVTRQQIVVQPIINNRQLAEAIVELEIDGTLNSVRAL